MSTLTQKIIALVEQELGKPAGTLDATAAMDLTEGWDSLKMMEMVIAVEASFGTTFSAKQMMALNSVESIEAALLKNGVAPD